MVNLALTVAHVSQVQSAFAASATTSVTFARSFGRIARSPAELGRDRRAEDELAGPQPQDSPTNSPPLLRSNP